MATATSTTSVRGADDRRPQPSEGAGRGDRTARVTAWLSAPRTRWKSRWPKPSSADPELRDGAHGELPAPRHARRSSLARGATGRNRIDRPSSRLLPATATASGQGRQRRVNSACPPRPACPRRSPTSTLPYNDLGRGTLLFDECGGDIWVPDRRAGGRHAPTACRPRRATCNTCATCR